MLLNNHLIEVFKKASSENNILLKENIVLKWVHRFGIDSLNDLLINAPALGEYQLEAENQEQNQEQVTLMDVVNEAENQELISLELLKTSKDLEQKKWESTDLETFKSNDSNSKDKDNQIKQYLNKQKLPLPYIKNLRKWINNDKKAS